MHATDSRTVCAETHGNLLRVNLSDVKEDFVVAVSAVELWTVQIIMLRGRQGWGGRGGEAGVGRQGLGGKW